MLLRLTHTRLQMATSLVSGLMLGIAILHLLPHAWFQVKSIDRLAMWMLGGFLVMFFAQRFFHYHHHDVPVEDPDSCGCGHHHPADAGAGEVHEHDAHTLANRSARQLTWTGALMGLTLHTLVNGVALAASVAAEAHHHSTGLWLGFGTFLAIFLHKPFDAMTITTLMTIGGHSRMARHVANALFALVIPAGVLLFLLGASHFLEHYAAFLGCALAFASGTFLCLAASDLLPELQFHSHDRVKLSLALLAGLGVAVLIGRIEHTGHDHHHNHAHEESATPHGTEKQ